MQIQFIILFVLFFDQLWGATTTKKSIVKEQAVNSPSFYQINLAALTPLYDISDPKNVKLVEGSYQFSGRELIAAEEINANGGKRYLKIPYFENGVANKNKFYFLQFGTRGIDGENGVTYNRILPGRPKKIVGSLFNIKDQYIFLDRPAGVRIPLTGEPGQTPQKTTGTIVGPSSKDQLMVLDSRITEFKDPRSGKISRQVYYNVQTNICPDSNINSSTGVTQCTDIFGWLPASDTIDFQREDNPDDDIVASRVKFINDNKKKRKNIENKDCPPNLTKEVKTNDDIMKAANFLSDNLGACVASDPVKSFKEKRAAEKKTNPLGARGKTPFDFLLRDYWTNSKNEDKEKLFAIDSMARALYGEMRGCAKNSSGYLKVVARVLLNRTLAFNDNQGQIEHFFSPVGVADFKIKKANLEAGAPYQVPLTTAIPDTVSSPGQVSSYNLDDPNLKVNLCPKEGMVENSDDEAAWQKCVEVANEAVTNPKKLIQETPNIDAMFYSSGGRIPQFAVDYKMKRMVDFEIAGGKKEIKLNNPRCLILWRTQPLLSKEEEFAANIQTLNDYQEKLINPIASGLMK